MKGINNICSGSTVFRTEIPCKENIIGVLQITNGVHVKNESLELDNDGSLIDIQTLAKKFLWALGWMLLKRCTNKLSRCL